MARGVNQNHQFFIQPEQMVVWMVGIFYKNKKIPYLQLRFLIKKKKDKDKANEKTMTM